MNVVGIAKQFGVQVSKHKKIRAGIFRISTADGITFSLKHMPNRIARLKWVDGILLKVRQSGPLLAWRDPLTPEGRKPYAIRNGKPFILTPWISGRQPSPRSLDDMQACGVALARFHQAGRVSLKGKFAYSQIGTWFSTLDARERYIRRKITIAKSGGFSVPINRFIKQNGPEILRYANRAKTLLRSSGYDACRRRPRQTGVLCHGDGGPSNFIINDEGTYLIDFETLHVDLRAYDLYRVIYNSCKDYQWDFSIAEAILDGYRQISKLNRRDYKLIQVWLRFPFTTYLVLAPFKRFPFTMSRLQWALKSERRIGPFLNKLNDYANQNSSDSVG